MIAADQLECPWGDEIVDLSALQLNLDQKRWFAQEINENKISPSFLAHRYNIKANTIYKYARLIKTNKGIHVKGGRPRIIDPQGFLNVVEKRESIDPTNHREIYKVLVCEHRNTLKRRNPTLEDKDLPKKLHKHTKERYIGLFLGLDMDDVVLDQISDLIGNS